MRRVLTILSAIVLLLVSLGIGAFTADLPFWRRALKLPLAGDAVYLPTASIGTADASPLTPVPEAAAAFDSLVMDEAASRASGAGSRALLVMYRGNLAVERYFLADDASSLLPATLVARPLVAMAAGIAGEGRAGWLDSPVAATLNEWSDDARGRITLRQLLEETSGLESGGEFDDLLRSAPLANVASLPRFATSRGVRIWLGNDYASTALGFRLDHEPGGFRHYSPANAQLAAMIIERATGLPYEEFVQQRLWRPVGGGHAEMQLDRRAGMPAAHCCWLATARDMLRVAALLGTDGQHHGQQVLPAGWVAEMARPSRVSAGTGLQLRRLKLEGEDAVSAADGNGSGFWVIASKQLVVLDIASHGDQPHDEVAALVMRALLAP